MLGKVAIGNNVILLLLHFYVVLILSHLLPHDTKKSKVSIWISKSRFSQCTMRLYKCGLFLRDYIVERLNILLNHVFICLIINLLSNSRVFLPRVCYSNQITRFSENGFCLKIMFIHCMKIYNS